MAVLIRPRCFFAERQLSRCVRPSSTGCAVSLLATSHLSHVTRGQSDGCLDPPYVCRTSPLWPCCRFCGLYEERVMAVLTLPTSAKPLIFDRVAGSIGCALPLLVISFLSYEERVMAVALLILSVSLQNLTSVAYRINSLDIAPR